MWAEITEVEITLETKGVQATVTVTEAGEGKSIHHGLHGYQKAGRILTAKDAKVAKILVS